MIKKTDHDENQVIVKKNENHLLRESFPNSFESCLAPLAWTVVSCPPDIRITFSPKAAPHVDNKELRRSALGDLRLHFAVPERHFKASNQRL